MSDAGEQNPSTIPPGEILPGEMKARQADIKDQWEQRRRDAIAAGREQRGETAQGKENLLGWVRRKLSGN